MIQTVSQMFCGSRCSWCLSLVARLERDADVRQMGATLLLSVCVTESFSPLEDGFYSACTRAHQLDGMSRA